MKKFVATVALALVWRTCVGFPEQLANYTSGSTLELVHVLYRHGDRNPDQVSLYPSNPYYAESNYYPYGYGQLTNVGKMREYKIGTALRQRYNNFLGKTWTKEVLDVRTTDYNRTKMSALLMTAGLWPPSNENVWNPALDWQPIPYNYEKPENDKELSPFIGCPTFYSLVNEILDTPDIKDYLNERYNETLATLAQRTGLEITYQTAVLLYFGFVIQEELNFPLEEWTKSIYPEPLHSLVIDFYYIETNTSAIRQIVSGYLIKKIIDDTQNMINQTSARKMFIYSAHETNVASLLLSLEAFKITEVPPYGSYVLLEIHNIHGVYGVKLFYQDYTSEEPRLLQVSGCSEFCPFDQFQSLVQEILPQSDKECYGSS